MNENPIVSGWLTKHLDQVMDEVSSWPPRFWPRLTGRRAEAQPAIDAELTRRRKPTLTPAQLAVLASHEPRSKFRMPAELAALTLESAHDNDPAAYAVLSKIIDQEGTK